MARCQKLLNTVEHGPLLEIVEYVLPFACEVQRQFVSVVLKLISSIFLLA